MRNSSTESTVQEQCSGIPIISRQPMIDLSRCAVVIVANDKFIDYVIPFLESFRESNPSIRLIAIPFDSDFEKTARLADVYQFEVYQGSFDTVDYLSSFIFNNNYLKNRMRKLIAFELDLDEFLYIDTDIIVRQSVSGFFGNIDSGTTDLIYWIGAGEWVYKPEASAMMDLSHSGRFATGMFLSSKTAASLSEISIVAQSYRMLFEQVRFRSLYDQPFLNFFFDITRKKTRNARELGLHAAYSDVFRDTSVRLTPGGDVVANGKVVTFAHWAGSTKFEENLPFKELLELYAAKARTRLSGVPGLDEWKPFFLGAGRHE